MFSVPEEYHRLLMKPSVDRFLAAPTEYDLCFTACIFLFHFCDVRAKHAGLSTEQVRSEIAKANPLFDVVHAVCVAAKHVEVDNKKIKYVGFRAEDANLGFGAAFSDGSYYSDGSSHSDAANVVRAKMPNANTYDMTHVVRSVIQTLESHFLC